MSELLNKVMSKLEPLTVGLTMPDDHENKKALAKIGAEIDRRVELMAALELKLTHSCSEKRDHHNGTKLALEDAERDALMDPEVAKGKNAESRKALAAKYTVKQRAAAEAAGKEVADYEDGLKLLDVTKRRLRFAKEILSGQVGLSQS